MGGDGAVYRISMGLFLWFVFLTAGTIFGKRSFHVGWWILKFLVFVIFIVGAFFLPNDVFGTGIGVNSTQVAGSYGYAQFSRVISAFFLVSQIIAFIDFAYHWNYSWKNNAYGGTDNEDSEVTNPKWLAGLVAAFSFNLLLTLTGIILLYVFYGGCAISSFFITLTAISVIGFTCLQLTMPDSDSSLLTSSVVALYSVYLCWSAVNSNPNVLCNPAAAGSDDPEMIALSMFIAAFSLGWTCYSATASAVTVSEGPHASTEVAKHEAEDELKRPLNAPRLTSFALLQRKLMKESTRVIHILMLRREEEKKEMMICLMIMMMMTTKTWQCLDQQVVSSLAHAFGSFT